MAHSLHGKSANFFFNGDFSGDIKIISQSIDYCGTEITVDFKDILDLVAEYKRSEMIGKIEQMETEEILNLKFKEDI